MRKKSEAILDFILAFIGIAILGLGVARIWSWFDANYAGRQISYQQSRLYAGSPKKFSEEPGAAGGLANYPGVVGTAASPACPSCAHKPLDLSEKWVFQGISEEHYRIGTGLTGGTGSIFSTDCEVKCSGNTLGDPQCGTIALRPDTDAYGNCLHYVTVWNPATGREEPTGECARVRDTAALDADSGRDFNPECPCYVACDCIARNEMTMIGLGKQIVQLCGIDAVKIDDRPDGTGTAMVTINAQYTDAGDGNVQFQGCGCSNTIVDPSNSCNEYSADGCCGCDDPSQEQNVAGQYDTINNLLGLTAGSIIASDWKGQACQLCANADGMEESAEGCCEPWDMCWWFTWGKACDPLKEAAKMLRKTANQVVAEGEKLQEELYKINECCRKVHRNDQEACFKNEESAGECTTPDVTSEIESIIGKTSYKDPNNSCAEVRVPAPVTDGCRVFTDAEFITYASKRVLGQVDWLCKFKRDIDDVMTQCHSTFHDIQCGEDVWHSSLFGGWWEYAPHMNGGCRYCRNRDISRYAGSLTHDCTLCFAQPGSVGFDWKDVVRFDHPIPPATIHIGHLAGAATINFDYYGCMNDCTAEKIPEMLQDNNTIYHYSTFLANCSGTPTPEQRALCNAMRTRGTSLKAFEPWDPAIASKIVPGDPWNLLDCNWEGDSTPSSFEAVKNCSVKSLDLRLEQKILDLWAKAKKLQASSDSSTICCTTVTDDEPRTIRKNNADGTPVLDQYGSEIYLNYRENCCWVQTRDGLMTMDSAPLVENLDEHGNCRKYLTDGTCQLIPDFCYPTNCCTHTTTDLRSDCVARRLADPRPPCP